MADSPINIVVASGHRRVLIALRSLSLVIIASFLIFNPPPKAYETLAIILLSLFTASILFMFLLFHSWLEKKSVLVLIFALDTVFVSCGLYLTGVKEWGLMTLCFLTVFMSALVRDVQYSVGVGFATCFIYLLLQYKLTGEWMVFDTPNLLKIPSS